MTATYCLPLALVRDDPAVVALAVVVLPQLLAGRRVIGTQPAARVGDEQQVAAGGEQARERRLGEPDLPLHRLPVIGSRAETWPCALSPLRMGDVEVRRRC